MPKNKFEWCLSKKNLLKRVPKNIKLAKEHIEKAKHNLLATYYNIEGGFDDWAVSQAYYSMYHGLLSVLYKFGYESKNHECTIAAIEHLIKNREIKLDGKDLALIKTTEQIRFNDAKALREEFQYGTKTEVNKVVLGNIVKKAKEIVEKCELIIND